MPATAYRSALDTPLLGFGGGGQEYRRGPDYYHDARQRRDRRHVVLQLTLAGAGFHRRNGKRRILGVGDAFIDVIPGSFEYGFAEESNVPYEFVFLSLIGDEAFAWQRRIVRRFGPVLQLGHDNLVAAMMLSLVRQQAAGATRDPFLVSAALYRVLMTVLSLLNRSRVETSSLVTRALQGIHDHADDPAFRIGELARRLDVSREHLCRAVRLATGHGPLDHLLRRRLELAAGHLRRGGEKLHRVAILSGFSDANYLCRVFRQRVGVSPAEFRRRTWMTLG